MKRNLRRLLALVLVLMLALPAFALADESEAVVEPQAEPEIVLDEGILGGEDVEIDPEFEGEVTTYGGELVADGVQADAEPQNPEAPAENPENPGQNDDEEVAEDNAGEIAESNEIKVTDVAAIGETGYETLQAAIDAADSYQGPVTINLLRDCGTGSNVRTSAPSVEGKHIILDLQGYKLTGAINVKDGKLELTNGTLSNPGEQGVNVHAGDNAQFVLHDDATIEADYGIILREAAENAKSIIDIRGTVNGNVWVIGSITKGDNIIDISGTVNSSNLAGVALQGNATVNVKNGSTITGTTGIEVRGGVLNVEGGTITGTGTYSVNPNNDGTTTTGVGIAVAQHTTKQNIEVNISSYSTIQGAKSLSVTNPQGNTDGKIQVNVAEATLIGGVINSDNHANNEVEIGTSTVVQGNIETAAGKTTIKEASVSGNVTTSDGETIITDSNVGDVNTTGGSTTIQSWSFVGDVTASGGETKITGGSVVGNVTNTGDVATIITISSSTVDNVTTSGGATIIKDGAEVEGNVTTSGNGKTGIRDGGIAGKVITSGNGETSIQGGEIAGDVIDDRTQVRTYITGGSFAGNVPDNSVVHDYYIVKFNYGYDDIVKEVVKRDGYIYLYTDIVWKGRIVESWFREGDTAETPVSGSIKVTDNENSFVAKCEPCIYAINIMSRPKEGGTVTAVVEGGITVENTDDPGEQDFIISTIHAPWGNSVKITATPAAGYYLSKLKAFYNRDTRPINQPDLNGIEDEPPFPELEIKNNEFNMPAGDVYILATFVKGTPPSSGPSYSLLYDKDEQTKQEILAYEYAEEGVEPNVTVMYGGTAVEKAEYTVSYENNTALGTGKVTVKSKEGAPHTFTLSREFTIVPAKIVPTIEEDELGNIVVKSGEKIIPEDQYNLEQSVDTQAGSRTVTLTKKEGANYTFEDTTQTLALTQVELVPMLTATANTKLQMEWPQQYGVAGYEVYFGRGSLEQTLVADVTGLASHEILGLKKGMLYTGFVKAYILVNGEKVYLKNALTGTEEGVKVSAYAGGISKGTPKIGNVTKMKVKTALTLHKGMTKKLKAKLKRVKNSRKPIAKPKKLRYYSTDKSVATVNKKGKVKTVGAGTALIYVVSGNGVYKTVTVTVEE